MAIKTGKTPVSMMVVMAIWSLSLAVDLPGLAVTPIEGHLHSLFHDVTDFKIQLLTVLPNVVIIPFVLLSGKLSETKHKIAVIITGILMYAIAGLLSVFSGSLTVLIWLSCLLGGGCGLILPFSTGLIADVFTGSYRMKQMGIASAIGNIALVGATFAVGFLAAKSWHLPFVVYLIPLVSLLLVPWLKKIPQSDYADQVQDHEEVAQVKATKAATQLKIMSGETPAAAGKEAVAMTLHASNAQAAVDQDGFSIANQKIKGGFYMGRTVWLVLAYGFFMFSCSVPTYYLPNLMPSYNMSTEEVSIVTSVFYFFMFLIGLFVTSIMRVFKRWTFIVSVAAIIIGFIIYLSSRSLPMFILAAALVGMGNGQTQPIFYNKATELVTHSSKSTLALAIIQAANYVGISLVPVIINAFVFIFHNHSLIFPFYVVTALTTIVFIFVVIRNRHFVFGIHKQYYDQNTAEGTPQPSPIPATQSEDVASAKSQN